MKKRFIVCHNSGLGIQDEVFRDWLNVNGVAWWHWLSGTWLIVDPAGILNAASIRDAVRAAYPEIACLVFEIHGHDEWCGFGPNKAPQDMGAWLENFWLP
jgi:hypothetical protein